MCPEQPSRRSLSRRAGAACGAAFASMSAAVLMACVTYTYSYHGKRFDSSEKALRAVQTDIDFALSNIRPVTEPLEGRAKLVIPSRELLRTTGIQTTGRRNSVLIDYIVDAL